MPSKMPLQCESSRYRLLAVSRNVLKSYLRENLDLKENAPDIPAMGMAVLHQQFLLV